MITLLVIILLCGVLFLLAQTFLLILRDRRRTDIPPLHSHYAEVLRAYTARHQAAGTLRQSIDFLALLRSTLDAANIGATVVDLEQQTIVYVNAFDAALHGYHPHDLIGSAPTIYAPEALTIPDLSPEQIVPQNIYVSLNQHRNGTIFPVRLYTSLFDVHGKTYKATFCQRILELPPYKAFLLGTQEALLVVLDQTFQLLWVNTRITRLFVQHPPHGLADLFAEDVCSRIRTRIYQNDEFPHLYAMRVPTGEMITAIFSIFQGVQYYFLVGRQDVTDDDIEDLKQGSLVDGDT